MAPAVLPSSQNLPRNRNIRQELGGKRQIRAENHPNARLWSPLSPGDLERNETDKEHRTVITQMGGNPPLS